MIGPSRSSSDRSSLLTPSIGALSDTRRYDADGFTDLIWINGTKDHDFALFQATRDVDAYPVILSMLGWPSHDRLGRSTAENV